MFEEDPLDISQLRYVLYARKSTDDETRQIRSTADQVAECKNLADRLGIYVKDVLIERKSAKKPNLRPVFRKMLNDLANGRYDAILSWNPDRLARNMREGGEIIDMIDEEQIQDLKFVTHHFTNDANGKMLLGMAFVLSKQYSDDLSQKVRRGMRLSLAEGKSSGTFKHGYVRSEDGRYDTDGLNFKLMCQAWQMRKNGEHIEKIAKWMNESGYRRIFKERAQKAGKAMLMDKKTLSKIFKDSFFYGVLIQTGKPVDLRKLYGFKPAVSEQDWNEVQKLSNRKIKSDNSSTPYLPLRRMVICLYCNRKMVVAAAGGRNKRYLSYRCDTPACPRAELGIKRNIRAHIVFDYLYDFLSGGLNLSKAEYEQYSSNLLVHLAARRSQVQSKLLSKQGSLKATRSEIKRRSLSAADLGKDDPSRKYVLERVVELEQQAAVLEKELSELHRSLNHPENDRLNINQFLNLSKNAARKLKAGSAVEKDQLLRLIFLNLTLGDQKVASHSLKEPFASLLLHRQGHNGRGDRT